MTEDHAPSTSESAQFQAAVVTGAANARRKRGRPPRSSAGGHLAELIEEESSQGDAPPPAEVPPTVRQRTSVRSWIWNFFRPNPKDDTSFFCILCSSEGTARKGSTAISAGRTKTSLSTSNLYSHIRSLHVQLSAAIEEAEKKEELLDRNLAQKILQRLIDKASSQKLDAWVKRSDMTAAETSEVCLVLWAVERGIPWNAFSGNGWDRLRTHLGKSLPASDSLRRTTFPRVYELVRRSIAAELSKVESCTATSDSWSVGDKSLVSLTVDYVDKDLVPHSRCGGSSWNLQDHSAASIQEAWTEGPLAAMPDNVLIGAVVCDGGSNFQLAGRRTMGPDETLLCLCHGLNRGAEDVSHVTHLDVLFTKLNRLISFVCGSSGRQQRFEAIVLASSPMQTSRKLIRSGDTRWFSTVASFDSFKRLRDAVNQFCETDPDFEATLGWDGLVTDEEFSKLLVVCTILQPFVSVCALAQEARAATQSRVPHWLFSLRQHLAINPETDGATAQLWKREHLRDLDSRFAHVFSCVQLLPFCCAALHPLYGDLPRLTPAQRDSVWKKIYDEAELLFRHICETGHSTARAPPATTDIFSCGRATSISLAIFRSQLSPALEYVRRLFQSQEFKSRCIAPPLGEEKTLSDPFHFWTKFLDTHPEFNVLRPVVRFLLSVPASSAFSERLWSSAGFLHDNRENLTAEHLVMLTVIRDWLLAAPQEISSQDAVMDALNEQVRCIVSNAATLSPL